ncbi:MAG: type II toxin-antitoxin system HicB family antitoxin [Deltaproteobacteria bacterium]|nr:type II toxin-antitoxin system HicB family antitoxin [Deltaproteobacteria bacterium]MDL1961144.1 type II toxin-antitoxin system HicB family antitoxin [Deltaproteobacteria bacterium]
MMFEYCQKVIEKAEYKKLEDGTWFAEISGFRGVWANGKTVEERRKELITVLEEWIIFKLRDRDPIPEVDGFRLEITGLRLHRLRYLFLENISLRSSGI